MVGYTSYAIDHVHNLITLYQFPFLELSFHANHLLLTCSIEYKLNMSETSTECKFCLLRVS